jgi:hypothetical protein
MGALQAPALPLGYAAIRNLSLVITILKIGTPLLLPSSAIKQLPISAIEKLPVSSKWG